MPDLLRISLVFLLILSLLRKKISVGYVMMIASAGLSVLYRQDLSAVYGNLKTTVSGDVTIKLFLSLSLIRIFEAILREKNVLSSMMSSVRGLFRSRRAVIVSMPLLIGMLPSLGGAYFSAPMVKEATKGLGMSGEEKAFINYWFRHPWEFILPLYPGVLLAAAVTHIPLYNIITPNLVYAFVLLLTGFVYSMREMGERPAAGPASPGKAGGSYLREWASFFPVLGVLALVVVLRIELHYALLFMTVPLLLFYRYGMSEIVRLARHGFSLEVISLIFGIMLFKETMGSSGSVKNLSSFFIEQGIPVLPIVCLLPFLVGLLTGITVGFVGSTFPLLISISGGATVAMMSLAFAAGFVGVLLSPVHLCLVLTREYFKADMRGIYARMLPASLIIFCVALIEYMVLAKY